MRVSPASPEQLAEFAEDIAQSKKRRGYAPNNWLPLARKPKILKASRALREAVMADPGEVPAALRFMIAEVVSTAAHCSYCAAHNAQYATEMAGAPVEKVEALRQFETSPLFTVEERAALRLAQAAGRCPPGVTDDHFTELKKYWSEDAIVEMVSVIALFGWLNRWNDTMATQLEGPPLAFAKEHLAAAGWQAGVHALGDDPR
ncbi:MAG: carboxymuconolactone decarboxylase family protein [Burkholderiales bacterium]